LDAVGTGVQTIEMDLKELLVGGRTGTDFMCLRILKFH